MKTIDASWWPSSRVAEAMHACAREAGLAIDDASAVETPASVRADDDLRTWVAHVAETSGLDAEEVSCTYAELPSVVPKLGPALVPLREGSTVRYLAVLRGGRGHVRLVGPDGRTRRCRAEALVALLERASTDDRAHVAQLARLAGVPEARRARVERALLAERHGGRLVGPFVELRPHPGASGARLAKDARVGRSVVTLLAAHLAKTAALLASWYLVGRGALSGRLDAGWLVAWGLALLSTVPLGAVASWAQGRFATTAGRLLKRRLLHGALRLPLDAIRRDGVGALLGRVLESSAVEELSLGGSLAAVLATFELVLAGWVLANGAGGALSVLVLVAYVALVAACVGRYLRHARRWTDQRLELTEDLVERMVGHRTRLAQEPPERWHLEEDRLLERYLEGSRALDTARVPLELVPRGWMLVGTLTLVPALLDGADGASLAVSIGGLLLALSALGAFSNGLSQLASAWIAWERVAPLFEAATRTETPGDVETQLAQRHVASSGPVIEARALSFRYPMRERAVLRECSLVVEAGDRVLLEGASGGGKSTLAAVLAGLRSPSSGLLLLDGLDPPSVGPRGWRSRVATVPQFHENHVLSGSFAFNACLARQWPPAPEDLEELEAICEELGLGPLLDRMPGRFEQAVGDQGWQLSHGERSRLFLARALLQKDARLMVLDESFAALDPITLKRCVKTTIERAPALVVIAHP
ncbi:MAG: ABC transporter ATP-binding protein [Sandaracinus sp.]|nr:ABC transporter ATP-binding protein [Sandaracinus sp.]